MVKVASTQDLSRSEAESSAVSGAYAVLSQELSEAEMLKLQLGVAHDLSHARSSFLALPDRQRAVLAVECSRGRSDDRTRAYRLDEGFVGEAFSTLSLVPEPGAPASVAVGFGRAGRPRGVLCLLGARDLPSTETLRALGGALATAAELQQLRAEVAHQARDLQQASAQLRALDGQREEFLGRVSHELKTPLTTVKTYLSLILRERMGPLVPDQARALAVCDRNSDRLLRLIDDLLLSSRLSSGQMGLGDRPFGLKALLEECRQASGRDAERAAVELRPVEGGELFVRGDRAHLREALLGLLDNAIRYNRRGGEVWCRLDKGGSSALVEIRDTGRGMTAEQLSRLFEPFAHDGVRLRGANRGLGRVHQVLQLHGGSVSARSEPDRGSALRVSLPLFAGAVQPEEIPVARNQGGGGVLLVEDDDDCREGVRELLSMESIPVQAVASSRAAIEALGTSRPALVLLDLRLGDGDGRAVVAHVRATPALADLPVFVMSGAVSEAAGLSAQGPERVDGFFEKPLNLPRLLAQVKALVQPAPTA